jgi:hypothetical protein
MRKSNPGLDLNIHNETSLLEALVVENPELGRLESLLDQFNIFEALNAVRVEVRHSDFLAYLLNPNQNHGLGDLFVKRLLQRAIALAPDQTPIRPIDLDVSDLDTAVVLREWQNIDILLLDETNLISVIIENKIGSGEHGDQLTRYRQVVQHHYPDLRQICLFLTPEVGEPSDPNYIAIDYLLIVDLVEQIIEARGSTIGSDIQTLMAHYCQMLRRHILSESEIAELCRKIYRKHQRALDLIYEYRPDQQADIQTILESLIQTQPELRLDHCSKAYVRFIPQKWDVPIMLQGKGWTNSGRILLFEFNNGPTKLRLSLIIGPGPEETRQQLFEAALENRLFKPPFRNLMKKFNTIYTSDWLTSKLFNDASIDELELEIKKKWKHFLEHDLPLIQEFLDKQSWIWNIEEG